MSLTDERKNYDELTNLATKESASWKHSSFFVITVALAKAWSFWWYYKFKNSVPYNPENKIYHIISKTSWAFISNPSLILLYSR